MTKYFVLLFVFVPFQFWYCIKFITVLFESNVDILKTLTIDSYPEFLYSLGYNFMIGIQPMYPSLIFWCMVGLMLRFERTDI